MQAALFLYRTLKHGLKCPQAAVQFPDELKVGERDSATRGRSEGRGAGGT